MMPTETEIKYFLEVYNTKHLTKSAVKLGISQPTLTQSINKLEEKIQTQLFHRTKQGMIPTKSSALLYDRAQELLELWDSISEKIYSAKNELSGIYRLGCHQSVGAYTLSNLFKNLDKMAPRIDIRLTIDRSRKITEKIISYELDLGFVINPSKHPDLILIKLGEDKVSIWSSGKKNIPKIIFTDLNLTQFHKKIKKLYKDKFKDWKIVECNNLELIRSLVVQGAGIGILPERVAKAENAKIYLYDEHLPVQKDEVYLAFRVGSLNNQAAKVLIKAAKNMLN